METFSSLTKLSKWSRGTFLHNWSEWLDPLAISSSQVQYDCQRKGHSSFSFEKIAIFFQNPSEYSFLSSSTLFIFSDHSINSIDSVRLYSTPFSSTHLFMKEVSFGVAFPFLVTNPSIKRHQSFMRDWPVFFPFQCHSAWRSLIFLLSFHYSFHHLVQYSKLIEPLKYRNSGT